MKKKQLESFERVDLTKKMKFKGIAPLADRLDKETKVMVIGEFHGGTRAFSMDNLLGAAKILEKMAQEAATEMYQKAAQEQQKKQAEQKPKEEEKKDDNVVDAEFEEKK